MNRKDIEYMWSRVRHLKNVVGYSKRLRNRIRRGKEVLGTQVFRVYVSKKEPLESLDVKDVVPSVLYVGDRPVETDVVEIGVVTSPPKGTVKASTEKTRKHRPVPLGVSVGNWNITAGSLGMLYDYHGKTLAGSNAHVLVEDVSLYPSEVKEKRILQPAPYHGGKNPRNICGEYYWHQTIQPNSPSQCLLSRGVVGVLNFISRVLGRKTRFTTVVDSANKIDFAVYVPKVEHTLDIADGSFDKDLPFIGHLFAGSDKVGVICKVKYIMDLGYIPKVYAGNAVIGEEVCGCSFWCSYRTRVVDDSASLVVSYGRFSAKFDDVILVYNDGTIKGGWSGSGWRVIPKS